MRGYDLSPFVNGKAFIHFDGVINGKADYGARICINRQGEKLFELPDRDMIVNEFQEEDIAFVYGNSGLYAVMNNKGEFLTDFIYKHIYGGSEEGLFEVTRNGKHGAIDINGREIIPCIYDDGCRFSEGIAPVCLNNKWGMIDYFNNIIIPFEYEDIFVCKNGLIPAKKNEKWGLINKNNEVVIDFQYDEIDSYCTRDCLVYPALKGGKWGLIDRDNNIVEDFKYEYMEAVSDEDNNIGHFISMSIEKEGKRALYSAVRKEFLTNFTFDQIGYLSCNRFMVRKNKKIGCIDTNGIIIAPVIYDNTHYNVFNEDIAWVYKNGKAGAIDLSGNLIIPCIYKRLEDCHDGLICAADTDGKSGYINKKNEVIIPFGKYDYHTINSNFSCGFAQVYSKKQGSIYIDKKGNILEIKI